MSKAGIRRTRAMSLSLDWDNMVKDGSEGEKGSKMHLVGTVAFDRNTVDFCTNSSYTGKWNALGMAVYGNYIFAHGCEYEGCFEDGMFHGDGTLIYPMGQKLEGVWEKGKMVGYKFSNVDGLDYEDNWTYCKMPDRRFNSSIREGLQPAGREFMTHQQPERPIQPGYYDTGDGFYDPYTRSVIVSRDPADYSNIETTTETEDSDTEKSRDDFWVNAVKMVSDNRHEWIVKHCRKGWDEPAGYRPDLYEDWITGRRAELDKLDEKYRSHFSTSSSSEDDETVPSSERMPSVSGEKKSEYAGTGRKLELLPSN